MSNKNENPAEILNIIKSALDLAGNGSKQVILDYLKMRYGMNMALMPQYKDEFENYLRETLGDSAEVIISKINENLKRISGDDTGFGAARSENPRDKKQNGRAWEVVHFLICDNCFWCASFLKESYESKCQICGGQISSIVPVVHNEKFLVEVDTKRGITLSFRNFNS
jgi:hypothetical protein